MACDDEMITMSRDDERVQMFAFGCSNLAQVPTQETIGTGWVALVIGHDVPTQLFNFIPWGDSDWVSFDMVCNWKIFSQSWDRNSIIFFESNVIIEHVEISKQWFLLKWFFPCDDLTDLHVLGGHLGCRTQRRSHWRGILELATSSAGCQESSGLRIHSIVSQCRFVKWPKCFFPDWRTNLIYLVEFT